MTSQYTDRYQALGISYPDPQTMCEGNCEGTGWYPQRLDDSTITEYEKAEWTAAHRAPEAHENGSKECDGWHFIKCEDCNGTGKKGDANG